MENRFFSEREGAQSKKSRGGEGKNNTLASIWASFGPVSRVVLWLQANDSRFLSTTILTLRENSKKYSRFQRSNTPSCGECNKLPADGKSE